MYLGINILKKTLDKCISINDAPVMKKIKWDLSGYNQIPFLGTAQRVDAIQMRKLQRLFYLYFWLAWNLRGTLVFAPSAGLTDAQVSSIPQSAAEFNSWWSDGSLVGFAVLLLNAACALRMGSSVYLIRL